MVDKIDSNVVGLRYAVEETPGVLPASPVWHPLEPNSYSDYGPKYESTARSPITPSRQRRKGNTTDLEVKGGFDMDFLQEAQRGLMPTFMFAAWRMKQNEEPAAVTTTGYEVVDETDYAVNNLIFAKDFGAAANNGLKVVTAIDGGSSEVRAAGLAADASPAGSIRIVGHQFASGDAALTVSGNEATLTVTAGDTDDKGLIPGEWIFLGDSSNAAYSFATAVNNGWYRIKTINAKSLVFDRLPGNVANDTGTGKTIRIFFGHVIKNESDRDLIVAETLQLEREFGSSLDNEYMLGQMGSELSIDVKAGKDSQVKCSMAFMGTTVERAAQKSGDRPALISEGGFTGSNDFSRLRLTRTSNMASIATYIEEFSLKINNNLSFNKAITVLGAFSISAGDFAVDADVKAYFASHEAAEVMEANADVSLDFAMVAQNKGWLFDIPQLTLSDGLPDVQKDQAVRLPLTCMGAAHAVLDHTLLVQVFDYLPDSAH